MGKENIFSKTVATTRATGATEKCMERDNYTCQMDEFNTMASGKMMSLMAGES